MKKRVNTLSIIIFLLIAMIVLNINTSIVSSKNALLLWVNNVVPSLFPFMFLTSLLSYMNCYDGLKFLNILISNTFQTPQISGYIYLMSLLCGYPMGANLTGYYLSKNIINKKQANKILTFTSQSGVVFVVGTVGVCFFNDIKIGIIIFLIHIISSIICGLLFKNFLIKDKNQDDLFLSNMDDNILYGAMNKAVNNILIVGGYIVIFSIIIDLLLSLPFISYLKAKYSILMAVLIGLIEITRGLKELSLIVHDYRLIVLLSCAIISFSGLSIIMQSFALCNMDKKTYIFTKFIHMLISIFLSLILFI